MLYEHCPPSPPMALILRPCFFWLRECSWSCHEYRFLCHMQCKGISFSLFTQPEVGTWADLGSGCFLWASHSFHSIMRARSTVVYLFGKTVHYNLSYLL